MNKNEIFSLIRLKILEVIPNLEDPLIEPSYSFESLGVNSLQKMEIMGSVMDELFLNLPLKDFLNAKNIGEIAEVFEQKFQLVSATLPARTVNPK